MQEVGRRFFVVGVLVLMGWAERLDGGVTVNDIQSALNKTEVLEIIRPKSLAEVKSAIVRAASLGRSISIAGGRHAMGGQQFAKDSILIDMSSMNKVLAFEPTRGVVHVQAGIQWPALLEYLNHVQQDSLAPWGIVQKQTGADRLSLGGALSANVHGRGLRYKPIIQDVESFSLLNARGEERFCSRKENEELFGLAIGGYGLFGVITSVRLRLMPRVKVRRVVELINVKKLMNAFQKRIDQGFLYGDFQYAIDPKSDDFLSQGVFSCYRPVATDIPLTKGAHVLSESDWTKLYALSHLDKAQAYEFYTSHYLSTSGQVYWSDTHQLSTYTDGYHEAVDQEMRATHKGSEMITEIYVPRHAFDPFIREVRDSFLLHKVDLIYGTVRLIEKDTESFLAWARDPFACTIFNLHVEHTSEGIEQAKQAFRRLIDLGIRYKGSFFLTYHRWATKEQMLACYPQFPEFLAKKVLYDPEERFQSDWYRHYKEMFSEEITPLK